MAQNKRQTEEKKRKHTHSPGCVVSKNTLGLCIAQFDFFFFSPAFCCLPLSIVGFVGDTCAQKAIANSSIAWSRCFVATKNKSRISIGLTNARNGIFQNYQQFQLNSTLNIPQSRTNGINISILFLSFYSSSGIYRNSKFTNEHRFSINPKPSSMAMLLIL